MLVVAKNVGLLLVTTLVCLGSVELLVSLYVFFTDIGLPAPSATYPVRPDRPERPDDRLGWSLEPNFSKNGIRINSNGLRSFVDDFDAFCQGKKTILVTGDSMVYGYLVDQSHLFTEILNKNNNDYCFINTGVVGYSTAQQFLAMKDYLDDFNPDMILWFFTQENDPWANARGGHFNPYFGIVDGVLRHFTPAMELEIPFYKKSMTYRLFNKLLLGGRDVVYGAQRLDFMVRGERSYPWIVTEKILEKVADLANSRRIPVIMLDIPSIGSLERGEADGPEATGSVAAASANAKEIALSVGDRYALLEKVSERLGFGYVRLWEYYPEDFRSIFIPKDSHWNKKGHEMIATVVLKVLRIQGEGERGTTAGPSA